MKTKIIISFLVTIVITSLVSVNAHAMAANSQSINGATGLIMTPTANLGNQDTFFGMDIGYHFIYGYAKERLNFDSKDPMIYYLALYVPNNQIPLTRYLDKTSQTGTKKFNMTHIPTCTFSALKWVEFGVSFDTQKPQDDDMVLSTKILLYGRGNTPVAIAVGGNYQSIKIQNKGYQVYQAYVAMTLKASLADMPSQFSLVVGKHFGRLHFKDEKYLRKSELDFSLGYDIDIFPKYLKNHLHWINEFANYGYSWGPSYGSKAYMRGSYNTGFRVVVFPKGGITLNIDAFATDVVDRTRGVATGINFGLNF